MPLPRVLCLTQEQKMEQMGAWDCHRSWPRKSRWPGHCSSPSVCRFPCLQREGRSGGHRILALMTRCPGARPTTLLPCSRSPCAASSPSPRAGGVAAPRPLGFSLGSAWCSSSWPLASDCLDAAGSGMSICSPTSQLPAGHFQQLRCPRGTLN